MPAQWRSDGHAPRDIPQTDRVIRHSERGDLAVRGDGPAACRLRRSRRTSLHHAAGHVPDDHSVLRGADEATVIRRECQRRRGGTVAGELLQRRPRGNIPEDDLAVGALRGHRLAVGGQRDSLHVVEGIPLRRLLGARMAQRAGDRVAAPHVSQDHGPVRCSGQQGGAVGGERQASHGCLVAEECPHRLGLWASHVPQHHPAVDSAGGQEVVGTEDDTANVVDLFDWRDAPCLPGRQVPQDQSERVVDDPARANSAPAAGG